MVGGDACGESDDRPRGARHEQPRLLRLGAGDRLGAASEFAHYFGQQVLEGRLVAFRSVRGDRHAVVREQRVHQSVAEEAEGVDSATASVQRVAARPHRPWVARDRLAREDNALIHHRQHQRVQIVGVLAGQAKLAAHAVEDFHELVPLALRDVQ
eukprot:637742-Prymnesium_polylepis.1